MGCDLALPKLRFPQLLFHSPDFSPGGSRPDSPFTLGLSFLFFKKKDYPRVRLAQSSRTWAPTWRAGRGAGTPCTLRMRSPPAVPCAAGRGAGPARARLPGRPEHNMAA